MRIKLAPWMLKLAYKIVDIESLGEASVFEGRTLEYGYTISKLAKLTPGLLLDIGCTARINPIPSTFCGLGWKVIGLDTRDYNFAHSNFTFKKESIIDQERTPTYDAITCVSTLEHIGLKRYGLKEDAMGDITAFDRIENLLKPGGILILTVPYTKGKMYSTSLERVYNLKEILALEGTLKIIDKEEHPNLLLTSWTK